MARRASLPVTVTLGSDQKAFIEGRIQTKGYASASEVVRAGLRALEREEAHLDDWMREKIRESLDDLRPSVPAQEVFDRLRERMRHAAEGEPD